MRWMDPLRSLVKILSFLSSFRDFRLERSDGLTGTQDYKFDHHHNHHHHYPGSIHICYRTLQESPHLSGPWSLWNEGKSLALIKGLEEPSKTMGVAEL